MGGIDEQKIALKPTPVGRFGSFAKKQIGTIGTIGTVKRLTAVLAAARRRAAIAEGDIIEVGDQKFNHQQNLAFSLLKGILFEVYSVGKKTFSLQQYNYNKASYEPNGSISHQNHKSVGDHRDHQQAKKTFPQTQDLRSPALIAAKFKRSAKYKP